MANSLEFSPSGHPIADRFEDYGVPFTHEEPEDRAARYRREDRESRRIDAAREKFIASGAADDYDPFEAPA